MKDTSEALPVHESLHVVSHSDLYQNEEWWKAVVTYTFEPDADTDETAIYLWHNDGEGWTRKNKYVIRTSDAWTTDREIIDAYIRGERPESETSEFPVSDYYTVGAGQTVFQSDGWWKAIVNITEKGSWETNEVMVYLWQEVDEEWRRRQKYTIKRVSDWEDEQEHIDNQIFEEGSSVEEVVEIGQADVSSELGTLADELEAHLSGEYS